ncbi:TPA: hypothetical protein JI047_10300 [Acinetobacter baumannii]|uniref:hypothetical protein n=1 Tax=Acinetobacter baumannii TaxID=470 RepID=UPI000E770A41|nr:hypothetical protein [Acinetobacter baumannii]RJN67746.1 hypothetical protein D3X67_14640 [Acinetobacter baumannii]HAV5268277.1 hypothetical protein [Acinetobacter baumannii]HCA5058437.1 hypothetical protein [Acinetobacter baumannii]
MKICIGGDLDGQVVEKDVYSFKATEIDPEKNSEYFIQSYILGDKRLRFWICFDIDFHEASQIVEKMMRTKH